MEFIKNLNLDEEQLQVFNYGFVGLAVNDCYVLMNINENDFNTKYKHYYKMGESYYRYEALKRILEKTNEDLTRIKEYATHRKVFLGRDNVPSFGAINTIDLIKKLKEE